MPERQGGLTLAAKADPRSLEQANVPSRLSDLPGRFWLMAALTGVAAGLGAIVMMATLRTVQHVAFAYHGGEFSTAVAHAADSRTLLVLAIGGLGTGLALWLLQRFFGGTGGEPTAVVWTRSGKLSLWRTLASGLVSEFTVGTGGSIGREAGPQRLGAAAGDALGRAFGLPREQTYLLIAYGAGAGLAAVYDAPLAGAVFAAELYLGTVSLPLLLPALLTSGIATATAWLALPAHAVYSVGRLPNAGVSLLVFALLLGPVAGAASALYVRLIGWASDHRPKGWRLVVEPLVAFLALGVVALRYPLLLGNGVDLAQFAFTGGGAVLVLGALTLLKPLATATTLRSGATGGLFTPTFSFGAILGAFLGHLWAGVWSGAPGASCAVIAAAAMMGAAMEAPVTAIVFVLELTHSVFGAVVPMLVALVGATVVSRHWNLSSIYSARLAPPPVTQSTRVGALPEGDADEAPIGPHPA